MQSHIQLEEVLTNYEEVIAEMKDLRTVKQRITKLGRLVNATQDTQLKALLERACAVMQVYDKAKTSIRGKTTPMAIYDFKELPIAELRKYCEARVIARKPAWQVEAERHGWVGDWKAEAERHGWRPPTT